ncbi:MAG: hypothetical protein J6W89_00960 [Paludibacteraceae bacterium]|nr:hypothetical protein [Paludibacteraceae bacterium]
MKGLHYIVLMAVICLSLAAWADEQDNFAFKPDSVQLIDAAELQVDSLPHVAWRPDPLRAVWLGAICPGLGQMYNRSWWKVPIVYGAFMGCGYAIMINQQSYNEYKTAYLALYNDNENGEVTDDPSKLYNAILPNGYTIARMGGTSAYLGKLQNWQNSYRRYRDISIVVTVVVYALSLVDAFVDAQLFDFDITPDLSMQVDPAVYYDPMLHRASGEMHLAIRF